MFSSKLGRPTARRRIRLTAAPDTVDRYWTRSGLFSISERLLLQVFRFGVFCVLVRALPGTAEYGIWALFITINACVEVTRIGMLQNGLIRHIASSPPEEHGRIGSASLALHLVVAALSAVFLIVLAESYPLFWDAPRLRPLLWIYVTTTLALVPFFHLSFVQQAHLDFRGVFYSNVAREGLFFGCVLLLYVGGHPMELESLAWLQLLAALAGGATAYGFGRRYLRLSRTIDPTWIKRLLAYGRYVLGTSLGSMLLQSADRFMLMALLPVSPAAGVALYAAATKIANLIEIPTQAAAAVVFPKSAEAFSQSGPASTRELYERSVGAVLALIVPGVIVAFLAPRQILAWVVGPSYVPAAAALQVLLVLGLLIPSTRQFGTIMDSTGRPETNFRLVLLGTVLNVILNYVFIRAFGMIGAAYGTLLSMFVVFVLSQLLLRRFFGVTPFGIVRHALTFYSDVWGFLHRSLRRRIEAGG